MLNTWRMLLNTWRMLRLLVTVIIGLCPLLAGEAARANPVSIQTELYGLPGTSQQVTALTIPQFDVGQTSFTLNAGSSNGSVLPPSAVQAAASFTAFQSRPS